MESRIIWHLWFIDTDDRKNILATAVTLQEYLEYEDSSEEDPSEDDPSEATQLQQQLLGATKTPPKSEVLVFILICFFNLIFLF